MTSPAISFDTLLRENADLRQRLEEAEELVRAIRAGEVDAILADHPGDSGVYTLRGADHRYRLLVEEMAQGAVTLNADGTVAYCNRKFVELIARPGASVLGTLFSHFVAASDRAHVAALLNSTGRGRGASEAFLERGDGTLVPVYLSVSPLSTDAEAAVAVLVTDLTEQKGQDEVVAAERLARMIIEQAADAIVVCDIDGVVVRASNPAHALCARPPHGLPFTDVFDLVVDSPHPAGATIDAVVRGDSVRELEVRLVRPEAPPVDLLLNSGPLVGGDGRRLGFVITLVDVSTRKAAEILLRQHAEGLKAADQRKNEFLAMLAHELRNPLAPMRNALAVLSNPDLANDRRDKMRELIGRQVEHLSRLVDDLLDVARASTDKVILRKTAVDLSKVMTQAVENSRAVIEGRKHRLVLDVSAAPVWLDADAVRLAQVVSNLLNNAAKYTDEGGRITLTAGREGSEAVISVADTGIGIDAAVLPRVFDLFTQVDTGLTRSGGGLGIGLTLVQRLVAMHDGNVRAASAGLGHGSEFTVRLPLGAEPVAAVGVAAVPQIQASALPVLVVDDNFDSLDSMAMLLEFLGHNVRTAKDGFEAVEMARTFRPKVILLDLGLPGRNGYQVAEILRKEFSAPEMYIVALSGYGQDEDREKTRKAGFDEHFVKPVDLDVLERYLNRLNDAGR